MTLAFYKCGNSQGYSHHTFDIWCDRPKVIKEMLSKLSDEELRMYDMDNKFDVVAFEDDILDLFWCVVINN